MNRVDGLGGHAQTVRTHLGRTGKEGGQEMVLSRGQNHRPTASKLNSALVVGRLSAEDDQDRAPRLFGSGKRLRPTSRQQSVKVDRVRCDSV